MTAPSSCTPCNCIPPNMGDDYFKQAVLEVACQILTAIEEGGGGGGGGCDCPEFIRKDGTTVTTAKIPFAIGLSIPAGEVNGIVIGTTGSKIYQSSIPGDNSFVMAAGTGARIFYESVDGTGHVDYGMPVFFADNVASWGLSGTDGQILFDDTTTPPRFIIRTNDPIPGGAGILIDPQAPLVIDNHTLPFVDSAYDLGSPTFRWKQLYLSGALSVPSIKTDDISGITGSITIGGNPSIFFNIAGALEATLSANQLLFNNGAVDASINWGTSNQLDLIAGIVTTSSALQITGTLDHNGSNVGFFGVAPATRPAATAEIKAGLASMGLLTDGGASPLNLDGGTHTSGHVIPNTDATFDLGVTGTARWRDLFLSGTFSASAISANSVSSIGASLTLNGTTDILFTIGGALEATMTADLLTFNNGVTDTSIGWSVNDQLTLTAGNTLISAALEIDGAINHDGTTAGFFGVAPATRPISTADVKAGLVTMGLLTGGGASPLDLGGGLLTSGGAVPTTDAAFDLGTLGLRWRDLFLSGTFSASSISVNDVFSIGATLDLNGTTDITFTIAGGLEATLSANQLLFNAGANDVSLGWGTNNRLDLTASNVLLSAAIEIDGELNHDGTTVGFYGVAPATRPVATADIKDALASLGLLTNGGASPLNLDAGALSAGPISSTSLSASEVLFYNASVIDGDPDFTFDGVTTTMLRATVKGGGQSAGSAFRVGGTVFHNFTQNGNSGGAESVLRNETVPANTLAQSGDSLNVRIGGTFAANANTKRITVYFGTTPSVIFDSGALAVAATASAWDVDLEIMTVGTNIGKVIGTLSTTAFTTAVTDYRTFTEGLSSDQTLSIRATASSSNDVVYELSKGVFVATETA